MNVHYCLLFNSRARVRIRVRIRFTVLVVSCYAHVFVRLYVVIVTDRLHWTSATDDKLVMRGAGAANDYAGVRVEWCVEPFQLETPKQTGDVSEPEIWESGSEASCGKAEEAGDTCLFITRHN